MYVNNIPYIIKRYDAYIIYILFDKFLIVSFTNFCLVKFPVENKGFSEFQTLFTVLICQIVFLLLSSVEYKKRKREREK